MFKNEFLFNFLNIYFSTSAACSCSPYGTVDRKTSCSQVTGQCQCLPHVSNRDCSACEPGFLQPTERQGLWTVFELFSLSHSFIDLDKPASLEQILKFVSPDATATLLAPQTVSVISLAANVSVSLGSQVNTVSAVRSTPLDSVRRVANVRCPVILPYQH